MLRRTDMAEKDSNQEPRPCKSKEHLPEDESNATQNHVERDGKEIG